MRHLREYTALRDHILALWQEGRGDSEEADAIRDAMDVVWYKRLTSEEREFIRTHTREQMEVRLAS